VCVCVCVCVCVRVRMCVCVFECVLLMVNLGCIFLQIPILEG